MDWKDALGKLNLPPAEEASTPADKAPEEVNKKKTREIRMELSRKQRAGKEATILYGFDDDDAALKELAAELKSRCGVGGSARGGEILLQGDCRDKAEALLKAKGVRVKRVGG